MNFDEAIQAHSSWKIKLSSYLRKPDGSLRSVEVRTEGRCPLGQWLHGEGRKFSSLPEYLALINDHAKFHNAAADVVDKANSGKETNQDRAIGIGSEYATASQNVVKSIINLKKKIVQA